MRIDLQLHSLYSDGYLTPREVVNFVARQGIKVASLADHNTLAGLSEFRIACQDKGIKPINGLELYCRHKNNKINILWYNFDEQNKALNDLLQRTQRQRVILVKRALERLKRRGFKINEEKILSKFKYYIPVNRLSEEVISNRFNYNKVLREVRKKDKTVKIPREESVINELFFKKQGEFLSESYVDIRRVVKIREEAGGQLIFCHPGKYNKYKNNMTNKLKEVGIDGIEVLSPHHSVGAVLYAQYLAETLDLIATGGSDFHRFEERGGKIKSSLDWFVVDSQKLRKIKKIIG